MDFYKIQAQQTPSVQMNAVPKKRELFFGKLHVASSPDMDRGAHFRQTTDYALERCRRTNRMLVLVASLLTVLVVLAAVVLILYSSFFNSTPSPENDILNTVNSMRGIAKTDITASLLDSKEVPGSSGNLAVSNDENVCTIYGTASYLYVPTTDALFEHSDVVVVIIYKEHIRTFADPLMGYPLTVSSFEVQEVVKGEIGSNSHRVVIQLWKLTMTDWFTLIFRTPLKSLASIDTVRLHFKRI